MTHARTRLRALRRIRPATSGLLAMTLLSGLLMNTSIAAQAAADDSTLANAPARTLQDYTVGGVQDSPGNLTSPAAGISRVHLRQGQMNGHKVRAALPAREEAFLSYKVFVPAEVHDTGLAKVDLKMPGLGGLPAGQSPWYTSSGGDLKSDSWSVRLQARPSASYSVGHPWWHAYIYAPYAGGKTFQTWGIQIPVSSGLNGAGSRLGIPSDRWFEVRMRVEMNTPGLNNGELDVWIDGQQGVRLTDVRWRGAGISTPVNQLIAETFYNQPGAPRDGHIDFKEFRVAALAGTPTADVTAPVVAPSPTTSTPTTTTPTTTTPTTTTPTTTTPTTTAPRTTSTYVSATSFRTVANGWGPVERDMSNGGGSARDGGTLTIAGQTWTKGLGTHAASEVRVPVNGATTFTTMVGVDDVTSRRGSVVFQIFDGKRKLADSGVMRGGQAAKRLTVDVRGRTELRLVVTNAGDGSNQDHADWADAKMITDLGLSAAGVDAAAYPTLKVGPWRRAGR